VGGTPSFLVHKHKQREIGWFGGSYQLDEDRCSMIRRRYSVGCRRMEKWTGEEEGLTNMMKGTAGRSRQWPDRRCYSDMEV
jgi:hypothetical protein